MSRIRRVLVLFALAVFLMPTGVGAQNVSGLSDLNLDDLLNVEVTTAARKKQKLSDTAAAVFVITNEDIRRSGATNIPEVLRMVPGLHVARIDENKWSIGTRGFSGRFSNKLLVMIDGRSVYTHLYSGVFWSMQDLPLEDIDRIEVVRGSGASLWGVNAVNGIINIITKPARNTQGNLFSASTGVNAPNSSTLRIGRQAGDGLHYRAFVRGREQGDSTYPGGAAAGDGYDDARTGFRMDWERSPGESVTVDGLIARNRTGDPLSLVTPEYPFRQLTRNQWRNEGGDVRVHWEKESPDGATLAVQSYVSTDVFGNVALGMDRANTADIDFQYGFAPRGPHQLQWGGGYRRVQDDLYKESFEFHLSPSRRTTHQYTTFVQDEIAFGDNVHVTAGSKVGYNSYSGFEIQPNVRALWSLTPAQSIWGAVSRAVRTPSRVEADMQWIVNLMPAAAVLPPESPLSGLLLAQSISGSKDFKPEVLRSVEGGYRLKIGERVRIDTDLFHNWYSGLRSVLPEPLELTTRGGMPLLNVPLRFANWQTGRTYGAEIYADARILPSWRVTGNFNEVHAALVNPAIPGAGPETTLLRKQTLIEGQSPRRQVLVRSVHDFGRHVEFDAAWRWVSSLPGYGVARYASGDVKVTLRNSRVEFSVVGTDLLSPGHLEYAPNQSDGMPSPVNVNRGVYTKVAVKF